MISPYKNLDDSTLEKTISATQKVLRNAAILGLTDEEQGQLNNMLNLLLDEKRDRG